MTPPLKIDESSPMAMAGASFLLNVTDRRMRSKALFFCSFPAVDGALELTSTVSFWEASDSLCTDRGLDRIDEAADG